MDTDKLQFHLAIAVREALALGLEQEYWALCDLASRARELQRGYISHSDYLDRIARNHAARNLQWDQDFYR
jgi:hypothetical protein